MFIIFISSTMKGYYLLQITIFAYLVESHLPKIARLGEKCDSPDIAQMCENYCIKVYQDCIDKCDEQDSGKKYYVRSCDCVRA